MPHHTEQLSLSEEGALGWICFPLETSSLPNSGRKLVLGVACGIHPTARQLISYMCVFCSSSFWRFRVVVSITPFVSLLHARRAGNHSPETSPSDHQGCWDTVNRAFVFLQHMFSNWSAASQKKVFLKGIERLISALSALLQHDDCVANRGRHIHLPTVASVKYTPRAFGARPSKTGRQRGVFTPWGGWGLFNSRVCAMDPQIGNTYHTTARVKSYFVN